MKKIVYFLFHKILRTGPLNGYRTIILFSLTFLYNLLAWLLDVRLMDFLCPYWNYWCTFSDSTEYNKLISALSFLAILLRIDTEGPVGEKSGQSLKPPHDEIF